MAERTGAGWPRKFAGGLDAICRRTHCDPRCGMGATGEVPQHREMIQYSEMCRHCTMPMKLASSVLFSLLSVTMNIDVLNDEHRKHNNKNSHYRFKWKSIVYLFPRLSGMLWIRRRHNSVPFEASSCESKCCSASTLPIDANRWLDQSWLLVVTVGIDRVSRGSNQSEWTMPGWFCLAWDVEGFSKCIHSSPAKIRCWCNSDDMPM